LLSSWLQASMREPSLDSAASRTAGRMALELLQSSIGHAEGSPHDTQAVRLLRAKEFIDRHLGEPELTLAAVARANAVSLRYLHLLFHDSGETARQYLLRRRLERAQQLLLSRGTAIPVGEVAARCGFDSPSSFSRAYRARYGIPPRDARREHAVV
jgi:AraC-like DNA-binding protein